MRSFISRGRCAVCCVLFERTLCCCFEDMSGGVGYCTTEETIARSPDLEKCLSLISEISDAALFGLFKRRGRTADWW